MARLSSKTVLEVYETASDLIKPKYTITAGEHLLSKK
jgi:hypothetical protein